jgi:hypothetical protein
MDEDSSLTLESNGLLDFFPTPPLSTENDDQLPPQGDASKRPSRPSRGYGGQEEDDAPPPEYEEEPSDFEDEMMEIMERGQESILPASTFRTSTRDGMDEDMFPNRPLASCVLHHTTLPRSFELKDSFSLLSQANVQVLSPGPTCRPDTTP